MPLGSGFLFPDCDDDQALFWEDEDDTWSIVPWMGVEEYVAAVDIKFFPTCID